MNTSTTTPSVLSIHHKDYPVLALLGKGKGGYSYLVKDPDAASDTRYVIKQIHHEPCSYYQFGNKLESEIRDCHHLQEIGIPMPALLDVDYEQERILKEYIEGPTVYELVANDRMKPEYLDQMQAMLKKLYPAQTNIDYYPTNFVVQDGKLYYIDYECNPYMEKWNFENWGIHYWSRTSVFLETLHDHHTH